VVVVAAVATGVDGFPAAFLSTLLVLPPFCSFALVFPEPLPPRNFPFLLVLLLALLALFFSTSSMRWLAESLLLSLLLFFLLSLLLFLFFFLFVVERSGGVEAFCQVHEAFFVKKNRTVVLNLRMVGSYTTPSRAYLVYRERSWKLYQREARCKFARRALLVLVSMFRCLTCITLHTLPN